jgi:hypothetical protein
LSGLGSLTPKTLILGLYGDDLPQETDLENDYTNPVVSILKQFPPLRQQNNKFSLSDYIQLIHDANEWDKSIVIARHFEDLKRHEVQVKKLIVTDKDKRYIGKELLS